MLKCYISFGSIFHFILCQVERLRHEKINCSEFSLKVSGDATLTNVETHARTATTGLTAMFILKYLL